MAKAFKNTPSTCKSSEQDGGCHCSVQQSAQQPILIKNGKTVNEDKILEQDVYIENGIIKQLGHNLTVRGGTREIDARGRLVIPGGIDPHTHMEFEFMGTRSVDDFYQGTKAAIAGGTTMIIDFAIPKDRQSILETYHAYRKKADDKVCCDYGLHGGITYWNDNVRDDMETLCKKHGVNSFKMFMTYSMMLNDAEMYSVFDTCKSLGAMAQVHAENGLIIQKNTEKLKSQGITGPEGHELSRPEVVEAEAVNRACVIANQVGNPLYVVHVMSKSAVKAIKYNREMGTQVYGETLAAALGSDGTHYKHCCFNHAAGHVLSPPLRPDTTTPLYMARYLSENVLQLTGSDHCTFSKVQKEMGKNDFSKIPNGVNGVEDRMSIIWEKGVHTGFIHPCRYVAITSTNAAKLFNVYPRKGCIAVGSDADIVIWNPNMTRVISVKTHNIACDFNIFEGTECHGVPEYVIVKGRICVDKGQLNAVKGYGTFVETPVFAPYVYPRDKLYS